MYTKHFLLNELPFTLTPNTRFFLNTPTHHEALNIILVALASGDGFVKITGEVGTGKTLLCRKLLNALEAKGYITAYIPNPYLSPRELRKNFALEIGIDSSTAKQPDLLNTINRYLIALAQQQKKVVLIIDEAQAIPEESIEALRLLTNLETESAKLFQIVLFGQPELDQILKKQSLRQLLQRITFSYQLKFLDAEAVSYYIEQRIHRAGFEGMALFTQAAAKKIAKASGGTPRIINILSHKALMAAYGKGDSKVDKHHVQQAIIDSKEIISPPTSGIQLKLILIIVASLLISAFIYKGVIV